VPPPSQHPLLHHLQRFSSLVRAQVEFLRAAFPDKAIQGESRRRMHVL
jgi:hypothetical protein